MIDYSLIAKSIEWYDSHSFKRVETPWIVPAGVSLITKPADRKLDWIVSDKDKVLVASGEQSFLDLYRTGSLPKGRFQTVTPCFRTDSEDAIHHSWFVKNELIDTENVTKACLSEVIKCAFAFFSSQLGERELDVVLMPDETWDIEYRGIELGSYGIRECPFLKWVYGTGCAEPRLSYCKAL